MRMSGRYLVILKEFSGRPGRRQTLKETLKDLLLFPPILQQRNKQLLSPSILQIMKRCRPVIRVEQGFFLHLKGLRYPDPEWAALRINTSYQEKSAKS